MKASEAQLLSFLKGANQFIIPIYQRTYSWTQKECQKLWEDILYAGSHDGTGVHFMGSIVYIHEGQTQVAHQAPVLVIDGQQRLTSMTLLLAALTQALGEDEPIEDFSAEAIRGYYLMNPIAKGEKRYKLLLSQTDKDTLIAIVDNRDAPSEYSLRIKENYDFFVHQIKSLNRDFLALCRGIAKLMVVDIALTRGQDNPQLIFESMNSTGKELSQADLVRNFVLMGLEADLQTRLYEVFWRPMEVSFGQEAYGTHFDAFMRHYLTVKTGDIPRLDDVYEAFKEHAQPFLELNDGVEQLVKDVREYARYFCCMALGSEPDHDLKQAFHDLIELKVDVAYPFLLELYADYAAGEFEKSDFLEAVRLTEAYVFRRAICAIPTNSMNKTFATFGRALKKDRYLESIKAQYLSLPSYKCFPTDDEFYQHIQRRDLYNFRSRTYWLRRFENYGRKERVHIDDYTIEHIMPQNEALSSEWREELGTNWEAVQKAWLHTLGNLTLTGYNSEYSDKSFQKKRDIEGGFKESPLRVNAGLGTLEHWNEDAIKSRAEVLAKRALDVWRAPILSDEVLKTYRATPVAISRYTIDDHHQLSGGISRQLFDGFSREVLALDNCVTRDFLKLYVAFKAETNFVDVIPQAKALLLSLNIKINEINDPKQMCRDVTGLGRWGNGSVELKIQDMDELPYAVGLVRQALDKQLGDGDAS